MILEEDSCIIYPIDVYRIAGVTGSADLHQIFLAHGMAIRSKVLVGSMRR
jgi:hypothetical protein